MCNSQRLNWLIIHVIGYLFDGLACAHGAGSTYIVYVAVAKMAICYDSSFALCCASSLSHGNSNKLCYTQGLQ